MGCGWRMCGWTSNARATTGVDSLMIRNLWVAAAAGALTIALAGAGGVLAQKPGGVLKIQHWDSPASMSIHEEATYSVVVPIMGVMNNLVMFTQDVPQNTLQSIVPALAESWSGSGDGTELPCKL